MKKLLLLLLFLLVFVSSAYAQPANYCNIRYLDLSDDLTLGQSDGDLLLRVEQKRTELDNTTQYNYSVNHASCYLNIYERELKNIGQGETFIYYDIVSTEPYENILPHGLRYSSTTGVLNFLMDMNEEFWKPNTDYTWQVYCYCLPYNQTNGVQDQHDCWYDIARGPGGYSGLEDYSGLPITSYLGCLESGNFTTGNDYRHTDTYSGGLAIAIFILLITGVLFFFPFFMDYIRQPMSESMYLNLVYRRLCFILATYLMILNSAIMAQISVRSGLLLHNEMFLYLRLFGIAAYILIFYLLFKTIVDLLHVWQDSQKAKRGFN